jgi:preprotein translocase subunit SecB
LTSNPEHKPGERVRLDFDDLMIEATTEDVPQEKGGPLWRVALRVRQNVTDPDKNSPYNFAIALLGTFKAHPKFPADKVRHAVEVNGSSILYGAARQILRQAMANGPYTPLLLPCASFVDVQEDT